MRKGKNVLYLILALRIYWGGSRLVLANFKPLSAAKYVSLFFYGIMLGEIFPTINWYCGVVCIIGVGGG